MLARDYLVIGAGLAGAAVCETLREYDPKGSVTMVGNESALPYDRSRLAEGVLKAPTPELEAITFRPREWYEKHRIELRLETILTELNLERRLAVLNSGQVISFRKACLATGSRARRPQVVGAQLGGVVAARQLRDFLAMREMALSAKNIIVIGGGLLAAEVAAALREMGLGVSLLSPQKHLWQQWLDPRSAEWVTGFFEERGVPLLHEALNGFEGKTVLKNIQTKSGLRVPCGLAVLALGLDLNLGLVTRTPLGSPEGVPVSDLLETDEKGIYAVGDVALFPDPLFGGVRRSEHKESTLAQAKIVGGNITGKKRQRYKPFPHHGVTLFRTAFEFVGDFRTPPTRFEIDGDLSKGRFTAHYWQGSKRVAAFLCNPPAGAAEAAQEAIVKNR
ncbi:MAG TPA: FAD-dependent oxidoreductase [Chthoniobacteraceae bacterium]|nr:FAD-dependent oxidoreductase [Chthoniobacteraceae bacterium]